MISGVKALSVKHIEMLSLWNDGWTLEAIGRRFGVTRERIRQILKKLSARGEKVATKRERNLLRKKRELDAALKNYEAEILLRLERGQPLSTIAPELGIRDAVLRRTVRHLIDIGKTNGPRYMPTDATLGIWKIINNSLRNKKTYVEIAETLSISVSAVSSHIRLMRENGVIPRNEKGNQPNVLLDVRRERIVRKMLAAGAKRRDIAAELGISVRTLGKLLAHMRSYEIRKSR